MSTNEPLLFSMLVSGGGRLSRTFEILCLHVLARTRSDGQALNAELTYHRQLFRETLVKKRNLSREQTKLRLKVTEFHLFCFVTGKKQCLLFFCCLQFVFGGIWRVGREHV